MVNINRIVSRGYYNSLGLVKRAKLQKTAEQIASEAREMQMLPKYLELETVKGFDRFNKKEISELTKRFSEYDSELSKIDVLKELLAVGKEKGIPLTPDMIKDFLGATTSMTGKEQQNVLKFLKAAAESANIPETGFKSAAAIKELKAITYINKQNPGIVEAISKCSDPESAAAIIKETGVNFEVSEALDALTEAYKFSGNKTIFPIDLTRAFYPSEIKQIMQTLKTEGKLDKLKDYKQLTNDYYGTLLRVPSLTTQRRDILKHLEIKDKIKLLPLSPKEDVYSARHISKVSGNFEGGKRR